MTRCSIRVGDHPKCPLCKCLSIKYGKTSSGKQRYRCNLCGKTFLVAYSNQTYVIDDSSITALVKEGCGIRSISRLLRICCSTVLRRIKRISKNIVKPVMVMNKEYEVDEMRTYYLCRCWQSDTSFFHCCIIVGPPFMLLLAGMNFFLPSLYNLRAAIYAVVGSHILLLPSSHNLRAAIVGMQRR